MRGRRVCLVAGWFGQLGDFEQLSASWIEELAGFLLGWFWCCADEAVCWGWLWHWFRGLLAFKRKCAWVAGLVFGADVLWIGLVSGLRSVQPESLILAQNERWRQA